jgi:putative heme iron utilization protein
MPKWAKEIQQTICDHMNQDHAEAVLGFVQQLADQKDALSAEMVGIDGDGMRFMARTPHGDERLMVPFQPPLNAPDEVRDRLVTMAKRLK